MSATEPEGDPAEEEGFSHVGEDEDGSRPTSGYGGLPPDGMRSLRGIDDYVRMAGGLSPEQFPPPEDLSQGHADAQRVHFLPGRFLLRLINVVPDRCPLEERTKFYLMSATVLLNAGVAAYTVPTGLSAAYPNLHGLGRAGLALLGAGIVGVIDALIVGYWVSPAKYQLSPPPDEAPPMPGGLSRFGVFIPRLAFTGILVFSLGLLLTISANAGVIKKQLALDAIKDRNSAVHTAEAIDDQKIKTDTGKLKVAHGLLATVEAQQKSDAERASCEAYGTPRVPGCSPFAGMGQIYREFYDRANGSDAEAVKSAQSEVNSLESELASARADKLKQESSKDVANAAVLPTGLTAVSAAWNQYTRIHGVDWISKHLMGLLVLALDIVPLGMKLFGGTSTYEADTWEREWNEAIHARRRRESEHGRLVALSEFYNRVAGIWRDSRLKTVQAWLDASPGEIPESPPASHWAYEDTSGERSWHETPWSTPPPGPSGQQAPPGSSGQQAPPGPWGQEAGDDPIREGRDARVGDIVTVKSGRYKLLTKITNTTGYNGDVFIAGQIRYSKHAGVQWGVPIRVLKFTRLNQKPSEAEFDFVNRFPPPGGMLLPTDVQSTWLGRRLIYESPYFPRNDTMRYLYGQPHERSPRLTVRQVISIMRSINEAHQRVWEEGFLHNDTRLRNLIMIGPFEADGSDPSKLMVKVGRDREAGDVLLSDWGAMSFIEEGNNIPNSALECDPAILYAARGSTESGGNALGLASDQYGLFACAYQLLTGGISPIEGLLIYHYENNPDTVASLEDSITAYTGQTEPLLRGWPGVLVEDPLPVRQFYPDVPPALANLIDLGVRANPQERVAALFGVDPRQPRDMADTLRAAIAQAEDSLTMAELEREVPARHGDYLWLLDPPVGWPDEVLDFIADNWPEYGGEA